MKKGNLCIQCICHCIKVSVLREGLLFNRDLEIHHFRVWVEVKLITCTRSCKYRLIVSYPGETAGRLHGKRLMSLSRLGNHVTFCITLWQTC